MDKNAKYLIVSLFFLASIILAILFTLWLSGSSDNAEQSVYKVRFDGSISGLSVGSEVRYMGIPVGQVTGFQLTEKADGVEVQIKISDRVPISSRTTGELESLGITGLAIIELRLNDEMPSDADKLDEKRNAGDSFIQGRASLFSRLSENGDQITLKTAQAVDQIKKLLSDKNISSISNSLLQIEKSTEVLTQTLESVRQLSENITHSNDIAMRVLSQGEKTMISTNQKLVPELVKISNNLNKASERLVTIATSVDDLTQTNATHMRQIAQQGIPSILELIESLRLTSTEIESLLSQYNENPSLIIYKQKEMGVRLKP